MPQLFLKTFLFMLLVFFTASCSQTDAPETSFDQLAIDEVYIAESGWPRTIMTRVGPVTLDEKPERIVSTSVTMSGTFLAIDAPLIGSGGTRPNTTVAAEQGFMRQWADIADERGVVSLYQAEPNAEAILNVEPDVIFISATGGDSALSLYDQLSTIAPTIVIGYDDKSWMQLAEVFGQILGLEDSAQEVIQAFEVNIEKTKEMISLPPQPTSALVYYRDGTGGNIWTEKSAQGRLLTQLGFQLAAVPEDVKGDISMGSRDDVIVATGERFPDAITGNTVMLFNSEVEREAEFKANTYLAEVAAVKQDHVYAVGNDTFRLDYYSSTNLLQRLQERFGSHQ